MPQANSLNNRFILEPYSGDRTLKSKNEVGFALVQQKTSIVGLRLLMDAVVFSGTQCGVPYSKGSLAYIKEELLFTQPWASKVYESDAIEGKFIIVDAAHIEFVVEK
jgi:hypothetical protein